MRHSRSDHLTAAPTAPAPKSRVQAESRNAIDACTVYLNMGAGRSLGKLADLLQQEWGSKRAPALSTIETWSAAFGWQKRASAYDQELAEKERAEYQNWLITERRRRMRGRARTTEMARQSVEQIFFRPPDQMEPAERARFPQGRVLSMDELDPESASIARAWFAAASKVEMEDFKDPAEAQRYEFAGPGGEALAGTTVNVQTNVVTADALLESRRQLFELTQALVQDERIREEAHDDGERSE